jgi:hypothetical protein
VLAFDDAARLEAFVAALQVVVDRHDILRTAVIWTGLAQPVQVVHRRAPLTSPGSTPSRHGARDAARPHRPAPAAPRPRPGAAAAATTIHDTGSGEALLALLCHHVVVDHFTIDLILAEVQSILHGGADALPRPLPYRNFIAQARAVPAAEHEAYFRRELADVDAPTAPFDVLQVHGDGLGIGESRRALEAASRAACAPPRASRARAPRCCSTSRGRRCWRRWWAATMSSSARRFPAAQGSVGADRVLGMFINTLPLRVLLEGRDVRAAVAETQARAERAARARAGAARAGAALQRRRGADPALHDPAELPPRGAGRRGAVAGMRLLRGEDRTNYPITVSVDDYGRGFGVIVQCARGIDAASLGGMSRRPARPRRGAGGAAAAGGRGPGGRAGEEARAALGERRRSSRWPTPRSCIGASSGRRRCRRRDRRGVRRRARELRRAECARQRARASADRAGRAARRPRRAVPGARVGLVVGVLAHPQGRRGLRAARSGVSGRAAGVHGRGLRAGGAGDRFDLLDRLPPCPSHACSSTPGGLSTPRRRSGRAGLGARHLAYVIYTSGSTGGPRA